MRFRTTKKSLKSAPSPVFIFFAYLDRVVTIFDMKNGKRKTEEKTQKGCGENWRRLHKNLNAKNGGKRDRNVRLHFREKKKRDAKMAFAKATNIPTSASHEHDCDNFQTSSQFISWITSSKSFYKGAFEVLISAWCHTEQISKSLLARFVNRVPTPHTYATLIYVQTRKTRHKKRMQQP